MTSWLFKVETAIFGDRLLRFFTLSSLISISPSEVDVIFVFPESVGEIENWFVAIAFAIRVFPVPGGPSNNIPFGTSAPAASYNVLGNSKLTNIVNKNIKSGNYQIDTYKKKIYIYGIARNKNELEIVFLFEKKRP